MSLEAAAKLAAGWCDFLEAHARRIYQAAFDGDLEPAPAVGADWIPGTSSPRSWPAIYRKSWSGLDTPQAVEKAVALLEDLGWVRIEEVATQGRTRTDIHVNPALLGGKRWFDITTICSPS